MNNNQLDFIAQYLRHRDACTAYCLAYKLTDCSDYLSIMTAANKLMDDPEVGGLIDAVLSNVRYDVEQQIRAEQRTELLTVQRKREILARIATGDMFIPQNYKGKDCTQCTQMVTPTINQMLKAIDIDNRMAGHYADKRHQSEPVHPAGVDYTENTQQSTTSVAPFREDRRVPRAEQETSESEPQQNTTKDQSPLPGSGLGEDEPQQNTTNISPLHFPPSPLVEKGPGGEADSRKTGHHNNLQQNSTKKPAPWKRVG